MPDSAARLLRLLGLLQRRASWSGADLAERLEVDTRTVRRDVERLRALGYQIDGRHRARPGGTTWAAGRTCRPCCSRTTRRWPSPWCWASRPAPPSRASSAARSPRWPNWTASCRRGCGPQLAVLRHATVSLVPPSEVVSTESLILLAEACDNHQRALFSYRAHDGRASERRVEPHRLVATDRRWYLVAFDLEREDWRTFRVDRISSVAGARAHLRPPPAQRPGQDGGRRHHDLVLHAHGGGAGEGAAGGGGHGHRPRTSACSRRQVTPATLLELGIDDFEWLAGYLIGLRSGLRGARTRRRCGPTWSTLGARLSEAHARLSQHATYVRRASAAVVELIVDSSAGSKAAALAASRAATRRTRRDLWLAAVFLWMTPRAAALSIRFTARRSCSTLSSAPICGRRHGVLGAGAQLGPHRLVAQAALLVLAVPLDLAGNVGHVGVLDTFEWACGANGAAGVSSPVREATIAGRGPISATPAGRGRAGRPGGGGGPSWSPVRPGTID